MKLSLVIVYYRLYILKGVFAYVVFDPGTGFWRICLNMIRHALRILTVSIEDFAHKQDGSLSSKDKWSGLPDSAVVSSEMEHVSRGHSFHLIGYFYGSCQILELFSSLGRISSMILF